MCIYDKCNRSFTSSTLFQNVKAATIILFQHSLTLMSHLIPAVSVNTVTVNFWLAVPIADSELARNMTVVVYHLPAGT